MFPSVQCLSSLRQKPFLDRNLGNPVRLVNQDSPSRIIELSVGPCSQYSVLVCNSGSYHRIRLTNPRLIHGTYVTRRVTKPRTSVKGQPCMKTSQKESRAMAAVVNNTVATGGVCCPTPRLIVTMMPK